MLPWHMKSLLLDLLARDDWDYVFKCDNDTYVSVPRFIAYDPNGRDYIGCKCMFYAHGGGGYWLSRRAAIVLSEHLQWPQYPKDRQVGEILLAHGMPCHFDGRFVGEGTRTGRRPARDNKCITTHRIRDSVWWECHRDAGLHGLPPLPPETPIERATRLRSNRRQLVAGRR